MTRKMLVRQERIFFRNIPLSNWIEQEMPLEEGADVDKLVQTMSIFNSLLEEPAIPARKLRRLTSSFRSEERACRRRVYRCERSTATAS